MLDDQQFAVTDQARAGIHYRAIRGRGDVLAIAACDIDALIGFITGNEPADDFAFGRPLPGDVGQHRLGRLDRYRLTDRDGFAQHCFLVRQCRNRLGCFRCRTG